MNVNVCTYKGHIHTFASTNIHGHIYTIKYIRILLLKCLQFHEIYTDFFYEFSDVESYFRIIYQTIAFLIAFYY